MRVAKWYKLHKDGEFYFLYRDRYSFLPNDHATKLSSALCRLSKSPSQGSGNAKTEFAAEKPCVASPVSKSEEATEKMAQEKKNLSLNDSSITVQHEGKETPLSDSLAAEAAACIPHDIQIHVQRPSPVREAPAASQRKLFSVGTVPDLKDGEQEVSVKSVENAAEASAEVIGRQSALADDSSLKSADKDEVALSSLENVSSSVERKVQEVDWQQRVRPTSGPATVTCTERPEFSFVRKSHSVTNSLDEEAENADFVVYSRRSVGAICSMTHDISGRSLSGIVGFSAAKDNSIRRIHSTVSFDRPSLKSPDSSVDIDEAAELLNHSASVQPPVHRANFYGLRSRHTSGLETPMSTLDTSSITSMGEAGTVCHRHHHFEIIYVKCNRGTLCHMLHFNSCFCYIRYHALLFNFS